MIIVEEISKTFGNVKAVQNVSFTAQDGHITGLLGPNGAGKSTSIRIIAGLLETETGRVTIDDYDNKQDKIAAQTQLGVLSDARGLYHRLTSRENIRYYGRLRGLKGAELENRINTLIKLLDMQEIADRRTEGFSTGQQVKVAIARILIHQPQNVILDEPTSGLDVMATRAMRDVIRRLRDEGKCVLLSSHIMQEVALLCERVIIIAHGRIAASGTADELRQLTHQENLEDAFVSVIGTSEGLE